MPVWICDSPKQRQERLALLKCTPCPHCHYTGALNRHGFLKGYDSQNTQQKTLRALRVYCSNRGNTKGCGRTFSVWIADKVKRLFLDANQLWQFLEQAADTGNKSRPFQGLQSSLSSSAPFRIWKRFTQAQSSIRTALSAICAAPSSSPCSGRSRSPSRSDCASSTLSSSAVQDTIAHLKAAFKDADLNPIAAFQVHTQRFFF